MSASLIFIPSSLMIAYFRRWLPSGTTVEELRIICAVAEHRCEVVTQVLFLIDGGEEIPVMTVWPRDEEGNEIENVREMAMAVMLIGSTLQRVIQRRSL